MITKQRLEELIEQGATIYRTYADVSVQEIKLNKNYMKVDNAFLWQKMTGAFKSCGIPLENLFETKEEAEWHKEFGCIERTESLELPTWEELFKQDRLLDCYTQEFAIVNNLSVMGVALFGVDFTNKIIEVSIGSDKLFVEELTKKNYTLACKKCKELFLGENK